MEVTRTKCAAPADAAAAVLRFVDSASAAENQWLHQDALLSLRTVAEALQHMTVPSSSSSAPASLPTVVQPGFTSRVGMRTHLSPAYLAQPIEGVRDQLNRSVLR